MKTRQKEEELVESPRSNDTDVMEEIVFAISNTTTMSHHPNSKSLHNFRDVVPSERVSNGHRHECQSMPMEHLVVCDDCKVWEILVEHGFYERKHLNSFRKKAKEMCVAAAAVSV